MTQLRDDLISVEVPEDVKDIKIQPGQPEVLDYEYQMESRERDTQWGNAMIDLPTGSWQLLCTTREASEEQAKVVVGSSEWYFPARHTRYIDYAHPVYENNKQAWAHGFGKAIKSLNSLLASKGLDVNKNYVLLKKG